MPDRSEQRWAGVRLSLGLVVHCVDVVASTVGDGVAQSERHDNDGDDPQEVDGQPDQTEEQRDTQHAHDHCVRSTLLPEYPSESLVKSGLGGRRQRPY